jgi:hypothetical protein
MGKLELRLPGDSRGSVHLLRLNSHWGVCRSNVTVYPPTVADKQSPLKFLNLNSDSGNTPKHFKKAKYSVLYDKNKIYTSRSP